MTIKRIPVLFPLVLLGLGGCNQQQTQARISVPPSLLRDGYGAEGEPPRSRYVVRMTDGEREWEYQLPEVATAYQVEVPLKGKPGTPISAELASLTAADREILDRREIEARAAASKDEPAEGEAAEKAPDTATPAAAAPAKNGKPPKARASYLLTLSRVKELYRTRHYEMALIEIVELDRQYPDDERILSMKGSIYDKLGQKQLARETWQTVLALNPYNLAVLEALGRLQK